MKSIVYVIAATILVIPVMLAGVAYMSMRLIFDELKFLMAKIAYWAGYPEDALSWLCVGERVEED